MFDDLLFIEAMQNYVTLHTVTRKYTCYLTFKSVDDFLPQDRFLKVHKSFIVALDKIQQIDGSEIIISSGRISISRSQKDEILNLILRNKLLKR